jgi:hypothetical protein
MTYRVVHHAYCGMSFAIAEGLSWNQAQARAARRRRWFAKEIGGDVVQLGPRSWELQEPEDCLMVPDDCGTLSISKETRR